MKVYPYICNNKESISSNALPPPPNTSHQNISVTISQSGSFGNDGKIVFLNSDNSSWYINQCLVSIV